jgi:hypothetical protein
MLSKETLLSMVHGPIVAIWFVAICHSLPVYQFAIRSLSRRSSRAQSQNNRAFSSVRYSRGCAILSRLESENRGLDLHRDNLSADHGHKAIDSDLSSHANETRCAAHSAQVPQPFHNDQLTIIRVCHMPREVSSAAKHPSLHRKPCPDHSE